MNRVHRLAIALLTTSGPSMALELNALWDYGNPALSEQRFAAAMADATSDERLILQTQVARTHGIRRDFAKAREVLATVEPALPQASAEVRVRYWLELGRTWMSTVHSKEQRTPQALQTARDAFMRAHALAVDARLDGLAIDALHMMVVVDDAPEEQLAWNRKALALMEQSDQPDAKRWEGSLRNNVGYALRLKGDHEAALEQFRLSRAAYERSGRTKSVRVADWMIARTWRDQRRYAEAIALQLELERAWDADGEPDHYVFEELELLYRATGDDARARHYAARLEALAPR